MRWSGVADVVSDVSDRRNRELSEDSEDQWMGNELRRSKTAVQYVGKISQHVRYGHRIFLNLSEAQLNLKEATIIIDITLAIIQADFLVVVQPLV